MMADVIDLDAISSAVNQAYGGKASKGKASIDDLNSDFSARVAQMQAAYKEKFGKDLPIVSGRRTTEEQRQLYEKRGTNPYPVAAPGTSKHETGNAIDIPKSVPDDFLAQFGLHRPNKKDPVHVEMMAQQTAPSEPGSLLDTGAIDALVKDVYANPPKQQTKIGKAAQGAAVDTLNTLFKAKRDLGAATASLADMTIGGIIPSVAGPVTYAGARAFGKTPEQAAQLEKQVVGATESPFGKLLGVTQEPAYKGEASRQIMEFVGQNISKGADWIAQKTGLPVSDVQNMMGTVVAGATPAVVKTTGKAVQAVQQAMPEVVRPTMADLKAQWQQKAAQTQQGQAAPGMTSMGSAAAVPENVLRGNIDAAVANASPELQAHVKTLNPNAVDLPALETRSLEEKHGINLTRGQRTGDTQTYASEWNRRGETSTLGEHFNDQPRQFKAAFDNTIRRNAPDIFETEPSAIGQLEINALVAKDKIRTDAISAAYKALQDANGGQFPIDIGTLQGNINQNLLKNLKTNHLSSAIASDLAEFYKNPTFESYEALRTNLANEMRSSSNGNARAAAYIVRDELERLPVFGENSTSPQAVQLKALADDARKLVRERQAIIKSNPAYRAAIGEAADLAEAVSTGESLRADKFHQKFVSNASPEAIRRLRAEIADDAMASQAMTAGELRVAMRKAGLATDVPDLNPKTLSNYIYDNKARLQEALGPEAMQDLMEIAALSSKVGMPKSGTFNYSNTFSSQLAEMAKQGLAGAAEAKLATMTSGASILPISAGKQWMQKMNKEGFAREAVNPYAGLSKEK